MEEIRIEFVSSAALSGMDSQGKVGYLIDVIRGGSIIVLEGRLQPEDERMLIEQTMSIVDDKFTGIEISSLGSEKEGWKSAIIRLLGGKTGGMTVIGPARLIRAIKKDSTKINLLAGLRSEERDGK